MNFDAMPHPDFDVGGTFGRSLSGEDVGELAKAVNQVCDYLRNLALALAEEGADSDEEQNTTLRRARQYAFFLSGESGVAATPYVTTAHASTHQAGGGDPIKLDNLDTPDNNTDLDFSTSLHGLVPKGTNTGTDFLCDDGTWTTVSTHTQNTDTALGSGCVAADHGTAATDMVVNVCYGTGDPPTANTTTIGALFIKYS